MITSKQRAYLRSLANTIGPIFQIGKEGISDNFLKQINDALEARELIKISVLENCNNGAKDLCNELANSVNAEPVQVIGRKIVLYRKSEKKPKIEFPKV
jgi:RNA-binding protein